MATRSMISRIRERRQEKLTVASAVDVRVQGAESRRRGEEGLGMGFETRPCPCQCVRASSRPNLPSYPFSSFPLVQLLCLYVDIITLNVITFHKYQYINSYNFFGPGREDHSRKKWRTRSLESAHLISLGNIGHTKFEG